MDRKQMLKLSAFAGLPSAISGLSHQTAPRAARNKPRFVPAEWNKYFEARRTVTVGSNVFTVYEKGTEGPVLFLLHGGGFSALSWALFSTAITELVPCHCIAMDLRGHGDTTTDNDDDLSAETLASDVGDVLYALFPTAPQSPSIILIGHSLGGAIAVHAASRNLVQNLIGLVVIDVVEGTALESLAGMESLVRGRPSKFSSLSNAIEWAFRSGHIKNSDSACVSMIGQLRPLNEKGDYIQDSSNIASKMSTYCTTIVEDKCDGEEDQQKSDDEGNVGYTWRIDLLKTKPFWLGWFTGLSQLYLSCAVPKLLLLAGMDRLDKDLTIGQMQGKFQMVVLPKSGHAVQEDQPVKVAEALATFMVRHKFVKEAITTFPPIYPGC